jgi:hypothetical protein
VVPDHRLEEHPVEGGAVCSLQPGELAGAEHPRHHPLPDAMGVSVPAVKQRRRSLTVVEPLPHLVDLRDL